MTHTSLVDAEDETSAAEKALLQIREADKVAFSVKSDEETITQVSIDAPGKMLLEIASKGHYLARPAKPTENGLAPPSVVAPALGRGFLTTTALVATGVVVGTALGCWIA